MRSAAITWLAIALAVSSSASADFVARRGSEPGLTGTITRIDDGGVAIRSTTGAEHSITWDRVREITSDDPSVQRSVAENLDTAENLWRARTRLERGDAAMAEPLFERLFARFRGKSHETALIVAEGLLRCRLARAANDAAIIPMLEASRLRRKGLKTTAYMTLPAMFDETTSLYTRLPPAWAPSSGLARVEVDLKSYDAGGDTAIAAIASLYRSAARAQLNLPAEPMSELAQDHPGAALLRSIVSCSDSTPEKRSSARAALEKRVLEQPAWAQAWVRFAIGQSLLRESGEGRREQGLVSLAHLPASFQRDQPYLAALALAMLSGQLQRMGQPEQALLLRNELTRQFPNHPALSMLEAEPTSPPPIGSANAAAALPDESSEPTLAHQDSA